MARPSGTRAVMPPLRRLAGRETVRTSVRRKVSASARARAQYKPQQYKLEGGVYSRD